MKFVIFYFPHPAIFNILPKNQEKHNIMNINNKIQLKSNQK